MSAVLIVEDDAPLRRSLERLVGTMAPVNSAPSYRAAAACLETAPCLAAILDVKLPDGSGLHLLEASRLREVPVLILTGHVLAESLRRAQLFGSPAAPFSSLPPLRGGSGRGHRRT